MSNAPLSAGVVGVLGGMGSLATVDFLRKLVHATPATADQDHIPIVVSCIPQVPDRTAAFRGEGASPLDAMISSGQRLIAAGADIVVMPCNTAHLWFDELQAALQVPMLNLVDAALAEVNSAGARQAGSTGALRVGLLATDATVASGLYMNRRSDRTTAFSWVLPTAPEMLDWLMPAIAAIKASHLARGEELLGRAALALKRRGADLLVLGCTEIPVVLTSKTVGLPVVDATESLARQAVAWSLAVRAGALKL